jgi:CheY-like chemotaxis protein/signal transduction histidine kinase
MTRQNSGWIVQTDRDGRVQTIFEPSGAFLGEAHCLGCPGAFWYQALPEPWMSLGPKILLADLQGQWHICQGDIIGHGVVDAWNFQVIALAEGFVMQWMEASDLSPLPRSFVSMHVHSFYENTQYPVWWRSPEGELLGGNAKWRACVQWDLLHGLDYPQDAYWGLFQLEDRQRLQADLQSFVEGEAILPTSFRIWSGSQGWWDFEEWRIPLPDHSILGFWMDHSLQVQQQKELLRLNSEIQEVHDLQGHFLDNLSHEVRTPLNAIMGSAEVLQQSLVKAPEQQYLNLILSNGEGLLQLMDDLVELALLQSNQATLRLGEVQAEVFLNEVFDWLRKRSHNSNLSISLVRPLGRISILKTDPKRFMRLVQLMFEQTLRITPVGQVVFSIDEVEGFWHFWIRDTSLCSEECELECDSSQRTSMIEDENLKENRVSRLGLLTTLMDEQVRFLGGDLQRKILEPSGIERRFIVPLVNDSDRECLRILLAEDSNANALVMEAMLGNEVHLHRVVNGQEAIDCFALDPKAWDLILMDLRMPKVDGFEATHQILAIDPHIPIVAITAFSLEEYMEHALQIGFADFLLKPISREKLLSVIQQYSRRVP